MQTEKVWTLDEVKADWARVKCEVAYVRTIVAAHQLMKTLRRQEKFNPYHDDVGRFTTAEGNTSGGGGYDSQVGADGADRLGAGSTGFSPDKPGWHEYQTPKNGVCGSSGRCSRQEMADQFSRFAVPGQDPSRPVENGQIYPVYDPIEGRFVGNVKTYVSEDGLTIVNRTLPGHLFHAGLITRTARQAADGSWTVSTHGVGNNETFGMNYVNELFGPDIFNAMDEQLRQNIDRHHGGTKEIGGAACGTGFDRSHIGRGDFCIHGV